MTQCISPFGNEEVKEFFRRYIVDQKYTYNFSFMSRPIIQLPQDMVAMQELIWRIKPDLIIETGIAHGGSAVFNAAMLSLLEYSDAVESGKCIDPTKPQSKVLAIDIDIRQHNRDAITRHPMSNRIQMIQGSSIDPQVVAEVTEVAAGYKNVMVCLDSNHTHDHVLNELEAYAPLVTVGSYCVVFDTAIEYISKDAYPDRNWGPGNSPMTAVNAYLESSPHFIADRDIDRRLVISVAPGGYLRRVS